MNKVTMIAFFLLFGIMNQFALSDNRYQDEVRMLVESFLSAYNQIDGIEVIGGPFLYENYKQNIEEDSKRINIHFDYNRKNKLKGWPNSFVVVLHNENELREEYSNDSLMELLLSDNKNAVYYNQCDPNEFQNMYVVSRDRNQNISVLPFNPELYVKRIPLERSREQIIIGPQYDPLNFFMMLGSGDVYMRNTNIWEPVESQVNVSMVNDFYDQNFLLFGRIKNEELLQLCGTYKSNLLGVRILNGKAILYRGNHKSYCDWYFGRPTSSLIIQRSKISPNIIKKIDIVSIDPFCFDLPIILFPLLEKPTTCEMDVIMSKVQMKSNINYLFLKRAIEFVSRFRDVGKNIYSVEDVEGGSCKTIKITTSNINENNMNGENLIFEDREGRWLLVEYNKWLSN